jgi:hypothetical protein
MQYLLLIYGEEKQYAGMDAAGHAKMHKAYMDFGKEFAGQIKGGNALQPTGTARTVRVSSGKVSVTDGPFTETKEQLGGYYLIDAKDADEAAAVASKIPGASQGSVEVRPIWVVS